MNILRLLLLLFAVGAIALALVNGKYEWIQGFIFCTCIYLFADFLRPTEKRKNDEVQS